MVARTATVQTTIQSPGTGRAVANRKVTVRLNTPGFINAGTTAKDTTTTVTSTAAGLVSVVLEINDDIDPPGTYYTMKIGTTTWSFRLTAADAGLTVLLRDKLVTNPTSANLLQVARTVDVRDWGVIGDGVSRPLSTLYGNLTAAQAVYPAAVALSDELDWAAIQSAINANPTQPVNVPAVVHAITNRPLIPANFTTWTVDGIIENTYARNTPSAYQDRANVIRAGNIHPAVLTVGGPYAWPTFTLNDIAAGTRTVTVQSPGTITVPLGVGDKVIVRSNTNPVAAGTGTIYDYVQINKVTAWNSTTGVLTLELPIQESIGSGQTLTGPTLAVSSNVPDSSNGAPWFVVDGWRLTGRGKLIGATPLGTKMGLWRCHVDIAADCQDLLSAQACVKSTLRVRGTYTSRHLELKFAAWENTVDVDGSFVPDSSVVPGTTNSIGEQATGNDIVIRCERGSEHTTNVRMFEEWAVGNKITARLYDYSTGGQTEVAAIKSTDNRGRPPQSGKLDLFIRASGGKTQYLLIGSDPDADGVANDADPQDYSYALNARTVSGAAPTYGVVLNRSGGGIVQRELVGDNPRVAPLGVGIAVPENAAINLGNIAGPVTYAANTEVSLGTYTLTGPKVGDAVFVSAQLIGTPTSGSFGDLYLTATVAAAGQVTIYIRNRSGTAVVFPTGNAFSVQAAWQRRRQ